MINVKILRVPCNEPLRFYSTRLQTQYFPPLALGTITAYLRSKGINVEQDDLNIKLRWDNYYTKNKVNTSVFFDKKRIIDYIKSGEDNCLEKTCRIIIRKTKISNVNAILISHDAGYGGFLYAAAISKFLKKEYNVPIIIGGVNFKRMEFDDIHELVLRTKTADFLVSGNGEISIYNLIMALEKKKGIEEVHGLVYLKDNKIKINKQAERELLKPDFKGLPLSKYRWAIDKEFKHKLIKKESSPLILPFSFIDGCPNHCTYCGSSMNDRLNFLKPEKVVGYLKQLSEEYRTPYFYFIHDTINISKSYINKLCDEIIRKKLKIHWTDCATIKNMDKKTLDKMRKAGCISLWFGVESGSQRLLNYIEKDITKEMISNVLKWSHEAGIWTCVEIISGLPTETKYDIRQTISFLKENSRFIDTINFSPFYLCKISKMFNYPKKYGLKNIQYVPNNESRLEVTGYIFDEISGLKWKEKEKQIYFSNKKVRYGSPIKGEVLCFDHMPLLFVLYSNFRDKETIKKIYKNINRVSYFHLLFKPKILMSYVKDIKTFNEVKAKFLCLLKGLD